MKTKLLHSCISHRQQCLLNFSQGRPFLTSTLLEFDGSAIRIRLRAGLAEIDAKYFCFVTCTRPMQFDVLLFTSRINTDSIPHLVKRFSFRFNFQQCMCKNCRQDGESVQVQAKRVKWVNGMSWIKSWTISSECKTIWI